MNPTIISALLIGSAFLSGYATMRAEECNTADPLGNGYHDIQSADAPSLYSQHTTGCDDADEIAADRRVVIARVLLMNDPGWYEANPLCLAQRGANSGGADRRSMKNRRSRLSKHRFDGEKET
ncbi:hypothetical protein [Vibrio nigripulchritudo]|uniref:hypothetical protein n=1 Tax=Vibrio nigripulchritudo TaxID=28173 RepID=UPI00190DB8BC|nr:hypothetical protein [Vibrio nigripulchritudo]